MINEEQMIYCLIAFILGYIVYRMTRGNGFSIGGQTPDQQQQLYDLLSMVAIEQARIGKYFPAIQLGCLGTSPCPSAPPPAAPPA